VAEEFHGATTIAGVRVVTVPMPRDGEHVCARHRGQPVLILPEDMPLAEALPIIAQHTHADAPHVGPAARLDLTVRTDRDQATA
jgi:hypothetical protein